MLQQSYFDLFIFLYSIFTNIDILYIVIKKRKFMFWLISVTLYSIGAFFLILEDLDPVHISIFQIIRYLFYTIALIVLLLPAIKDYNEVYTKKKINKNYFYLILLIVPLFSLLIPITSQFIQLHIALLFNIFIGMMLYLLVYIKKKTPSFAFVFVVIVISFLTVFTSLLNFLSGFQIFWDLSYITNILLLTFVLVTAIVSFPEDKILRSEKKSLEAYKQAVIERDRAQELSMFAHTMAHDLKNNLSVIYGYAEILKSEKNFNYLKNIKKHIDTMNNLINRSLDLADSGKIIDNKDEVNLNEVISEIAEITIPKKITFKKDNLPSVKGDRQKIIQIFNNLLLNAVIHGKPTIISIKTINHNDKIIISIINNGEKIPNEHLDKIFEHGFTTQEKNSGIGLVIVNRIIKAHGWSITLKNQPETNFQIHIPKNLTITS
ncbi:MAG: GHKL domain-containing protein [Candidatus Lokiarchaeota archaeon]|nr:GHKL domain-containing protein [Candidatus Lokiarchaeota archaeon]